MNTQIPKITEEKIKRFYLANLEKSQDDNEIHYRTDEILPKETPHKIAPPQDIPHLMNHYINQIITSSYSLSPIEVAAMAYKRFLDIYPFENYNEETGMAIVSYLFQQAGFFFPGIPNYMTKEYKKAVEQAQKTGMPDDLIHCFSNIIKLYND